MSYILRYLTYGWGKRRGEQRRRILVAGHSHGSGTSTARTSSRLGSLSRALLYPVRDLGRLRKRRVFGPAHLAVPLLGDLAEQRLIEALAGVDLAAGEPPLARVPLGAPRPLQQQAGGSTPGAWRLFIFRLLSASVNGVGITWRQWGDQMKEVLDKEARALGWQVNAQVLGRTIRIPSSIQQQVRELPRNEIASGRSPSMFSIRNGIRLKGRNLAVSATTFKDHPKATRRAPRKHGGSHSLRSVASPSWPQAGPVVFCSVCSRRDVSGVAATTI